MARRRANTTKNEIIQSAAIHFLEKGYSNTSPKDICQELGISTGNLTYYFPNKEHLLSVFVDMLCDFQWKMMELEAKEGLSSVMAICLELTSMAVMCEEDEIAKDFYLAAYTSPITLGLIRRNDAKRSKLVFKDYCPDWTDEKFAEAETIVSGIEYATLMTTPDSAHLETRIEGALTTILRTFNVPEDVIKIKLEKVFRMDYRKIGRRVLREFKEYVIEKCEKALEDI